MMKKIYILLMIMLLAFAVCGCKNGKSEDNGKINVVATIFPEYDFIRQIAGDKVNLTLLLPPGSESHSFEPTPKDIVTINKAQLFVYNGGDSDAWVETIIESLDTKNIKIVSMMNSVDLLCNEDHDHEHEHEEEYDEHIWTSPKNAIKMVEKLRDELCAIDEANADFYKENAKTYINKLEELDSKFEKTISEAKRKTIVVGDRFPFLYFAKAYGLSYEAAFPSCSTQSEPSADTIAKLIDKVKNDNIPVVFHTELSNTKVCQAICEATGAKEQTLYAVHNISKADFEAGVTYLDLMEKNVLSLQEALN
ncbi:MAG: zinc ABC transporter substrate-binding protein [Lachnospiraceae bacterium]|nr:zinc ABC transporter substrate-binding protein [Lachnospiraceae bacterium]